MDFPSPLIPGWVEVLAWSLYLPLLLYAATRAPWRCLRNRAAMHLLGAACVVLLVLWRMQAGISPGLAIHYLGVTALTLVVGWPFALLDVGLALAVMAGFGAPSWSSLALSGLLLGGLPVGISYGLLRLAQKHLPANLFIYILVNGFFGAGFAVAAAVLSVAGVQLIAGVYGIDRISSELLIYLPLIMLPEGLLNGMAVAVIVATRPEWLATFDTRRYLGEGY